MSEEYQDPLAKKIIIGEGIYQTEDGTLHMNYISQFMFDAILAEILDEMTGDQILGLPGVYECVSEEFNNEVIKRWEERR